VTLRLRLIREVLFELPEVPKLRQPEHSGATRSERGRDYYHARLRQKFGYRALPFDLFTGMQELLLGQLLTLAIFRPNDRSHFTSLDPPKSTRPDVIMMSGSRLSTISPFCYKLNSA
jgi:hypothetical protein